MRLAASPLTQIRSLEGPILVTGHTGFKGAWLGLLLDSLSIPYVGYSLKPEPGSLYERLGSEPSASEVFANILDLEILKEFISQHNVKAIIHMAAQPLVLTSYQEPLETFAVNALGTANILNAACHAPDVKAVLAVTTDKVYRNSNDGKDFKESDPLQGHDPYSASKVAAESAVDAWRKIVSQMGGPRILSVRAGNVIGGGDWSENRLIPDLVRGFSKSATVEIRSPGSTRPWQHVLDPLVGYLLALENALLGSDISSFNFGPSTPSLSVRTVTEIAKNTWPHNPKVEYFEKNDSLEAKTLGLDPSLANKELNWHANWSQEAAVTSSIEWWLKVLTEQTDPLMACKADIASVLQVEE
ncbi:CDP-glucose 4,6-dehydratase [Actinobacteria bacterium IMCC25003]|nr:CDP-glucose 4,6-dehydratase [Actinobacteria bacterium IMCC25003]